MCCATMRETASDERRGALGATVLPRATTPGGRCVCPSRSAAGSGARDRLRSVDSTVWTSELACIDGRDSVVGLATAAAAGRSTSRTDGVGCSGRAGSGACSTRTTGTSPARGGEGGVGSSWTGAAAGLAWGAAFGGASGKRAAGADTSAGDTPTSAGCLDGAGASCGEADLRGAGSERSS